MFRLFSLLPDLVQIEVHGNFIRYLLPFCDSNKNEQEVTKLHNPLRIYKNL